MDLITIQYVVTAILAIWGTLSVTKWKEISKIGKLFSTSTIVGAILLGYNTISEHRKKLLMEKIEETFVIIENNETSDKPIFQVAGAVTQFETPSGDFLGGVRPVV